MSQNPKWRNMKKVMKTIAAAGLMSIAFTALVTPPAMAAEKAQPWAANSKAQSTKAYWDNELKDLAIHNNELYSGYGNFGADIGPIDLISHNINTGAETNHILVPTEDIDGIKNLNGSLYIPYIDPKAPWTSDVGYATNASGAWENVDVTPFIHVFDIESVGSELWMSGSIVNPDKSKYGTASNIAAVKRSTDGGATWTIEKARSSTNESSRDFDRFYWLEEVNGKLYTNANTDTTKNTLDVWENGVWSEVQSKFPISITRGSQVESIGDTIIASSSSKFYTYNTRTGDELTVDGKFIQDLYVDGDILYALSAGYGSEGRELSSTKDGINWKQHNVLDAPKLDQKVINNADGSTTFVKPIITSIAVQGKTAFYGMNTGEIYKEAITDKAGAPAPLKSTVRIAAPGYDLTPDTLMTPLAGVTALANDGTDVTNLVKATRKVDWKGMTVVYTVKYKNITTTVSRNVNLSDQISD